MIFARQVYAAVLSASFDCMSARSEEGIYRDLSEQARTITREVARFVKTGQRSIVDRYLSQAQNEEIDTSYAAAKERIGIALQRLRILIGPGADGRMCPWLGSATTKVMTASRATRKIHFLPVRSRRLKSPGVKRAGQRRVSPQTPRRWERWRQH